MSSKWIEYRSQVTGKTPDQIREEMRNRGKSGGAPKGKPKSKEHRRKLSEAFWKQRGGKPSETR